MTLTSEAPEQTPESQSRRSERKSSEQTIKDLFVVLGCLMMFMCFGLLLETNLHEWSEAQSKRMSIVCIFVLLLFGTIFVCYFYSRFFSRRILLRQRDEENQQQNTERRDSPPTYSQVMGLPPNYYHAIKIPNMGIYDKFEEPDLVTHM